MEAGPQAGCVAAFAIGAWTRRAGGSERAFTTSLSMVTYVPDMPITIGICNKYRVLYVRRIR